MFPWSSFSTCSAASPCARLSRAPSTTGESDSHDGVCFPMDGPFSLRTRPIVSDDQDRRGSPRFRFASVSARAVLSDPAGVSSPLASFGSLLLPSKFSTLSASGLSCHEAQSLHLRYGPDVALPTLSPCRYLHKPKARFLVGRLFPLPARESHPLEAPGFAWRTEELGDIDINHPFISLLGIFLGCFDRIMRASPGPESVTVWAESRIENRRQHLQ
jgi:hypothetical protein